MNGIIMWLNGKELEACSYEADLLDGYREV